MIVMIEYDERREWQDCDLTITIGLYIGFLKSQQFNLLYKLLTKEHLISKVSGAIVWFSIMSSSEKVMYGTACFI